MARYIWAVAAQVHFDPSSEPALRQCHETSLTFSGDQVDFGQCEEVVSFFIGLFCEEKDPALAFWAPSALSQKAQKVKRVLFQTKHTIKMIPLRETGKICEWSREWQ